jgi:hypothetical protein
MQGGVCRVEACPPAGSPHQASDMGFATADTRIADAPAGAI